MLRKSKRDKRNARAGSYATFLIGRWKFRATEAQCPFSNCHISSPMRLWPSSSPSSDVCRPPEHANYSAYAAHELLHPHMCRNISFRENKFPGRLHLVTRRSAFMELSKLLCRAFVHLHVSMMTQSSLCFLVLLADPQIL